MDEGQVILMAIKNGWRWVEGRLYWCKEWKMDDIDDGPGRKENLFKGKEKSKG